MSLPTTKLLNIRNYETMNRHYTNEKYALSSKKLRKIKFHSTNKELNKSIVLSLIHAHNQDMKEIINYKKNNSL